MSETATCVSRVIPKGQWGWYHAYDCGKPAKGELDGKPACGLHIGAAKRAVKQRAAADERWQQKQKAWQEDFNRRQSYPALLAAARAVAPGVGRALTLADNGVQQVYIAVPVDAYDALRAAVEAADR